MRSRDWPFAYAAVLRLGEPAALRDARMLANPYVRESLRKAFDAGWYSWRRVNLEGGAARPPQFSSLGGSAYARGRTARDQYETSWKEHDGRSTQSR